VTDSFSKDVLIPLVHGTDLERGQARAALEAILEGRVDAVLISSFLTALTAKGETADEMTGFIDAMMATATTFSVGPDVIDIVGTGGDQLHTVNISTMAALAVAGCGVPVAKHGNRAASSSVGSADVLEALGVRLDTSESVVRASIEGANIGFLFAPTFHHALGYLTPIRRSLGFRTIFNVLGPLANPAQVRRSLIGVAQAPLLAHMAWVLVARGVDYAILVNSDDGRTLTRFPFNAARHNPTRCRRTANRRQQRTRTSPRRRRHSRRGYRTERARGA
jgi:anthranilate phosphoribosyltransferase